MNNHQTLEGQSNNLVSRVVQEFRDQQHRLLEAEINLSVCRYRLEQQRSASRKHWEALGMAGAEVDRIKAALWPRSSLTMVAKIIRAAQAEQLDLKLCKRCSGLGRLNLALERVPCEECAGGGYRRLSDRRRAASLGRDESTYRAKWRSVYEWIYERLNESSSRL